MEKLRELEMGVAASLFQTWAWYKSIKQTGLREGGEQNKGGRVAGQGLEPPEL